MAFRGCSACKTRWAQGKRGLCRSCERAAGDTRNTVEREGERVERMRAKQTGADPPPSADEPRTRTHVIDGIEYVTVWDGSK